MPRNADRKKAGEKRYRAEHTEWFRVFERRRHLRRMYGMTEDQWQTTFEAQHHCCAICQTPDLIGNSKWHNDHITRNGKPFVRGILCHFCNLIVNKRMTANTLRKAADYMEHHDVYA